MNLNESTVEDAALGWFGKLGYAVGHGPQMAPGEAAAERDSFGEVVLVGRLREVLRQLNPANPHQSRTLPTLRDTLSPKLLGGELAVGAAFIGSILSGESRAPLQGHTAKTNAVDSSKISATK